MREFDLLRHVYKSNDRLGEHLLLPPGDDMAALRFGNGVLLAATDQVIDGVHVDLARTPLELVARKAIARSVSDIAAMAGRPFASLVSVALPVKFGEDRAAALFDAMRDAASEMRCPLVGGDIAIYGRDGDSSVFLSSVTVLAEAPEGRFVTRGGARVGDHVFVSGVLGGSLQADGLGHHLTFQPRLSEARALLEALGENLHAMIDVSDGLGRDAGHIAQQSGVAIEIDADALPIRQGASRSQAISDGEDYELCFTVTAGAQLPTIEGVPLTRIGTVIDPAKAGVATGTVLLMHTTGERQNISDLGWEHR